MLLGFIHESTTSQHVELTKRPPIRPTQLGKHGQSQIVHLADSVGVDDVAVEDAGGVAHG